MNKLLLTACLCLCALGVFSLSINGRAEKSTFETYNYPELEHWKSVFANDHSKKRPSQPKPLKRNDLASNGLDSFDVSQKWPQCKDVFEDIQVQGNCSGSWATSVATSIRDRRCIAFKEKDPISSYDLLSCCEECKLDGVNGCNGGDVYAAMNYFLNSGIVTGGAYESGEGCRPYIIRPNSNAPTPAFTKCLPRCDSTYKKKSYVQDKLYGKKQLTFSYNNQRVMDEIQANGAVVAEMELYEDFLSYKSGVYKHKSGDFLGYHYVKILGWGKSPAPDNQLYWKAANSFGGNWGEQGTFRILRGTDESSFELNIHAALVKADTPINPPTNQPPHEILTCPSVTAAYLGKFQYDKNPGDILNVKFGFRLSINEAHNLMTMDQIKWDNQYAGGNDYTMQLWRHSDNVFTDCNKTTTCTIPFQPVIKDFSISVRAPVNAAAYHFITYLELDGALKLSKTIGQCTNVAPEEWDDSWRANPALFTTCYCCGEYLPSKELGCPTYPWS